MIQALVSFPNAPDQKRAEALKGSTVPLNSRLLNLDVRLRYKVGLAQAM